MIAVQTQPTTDEDWTKLFNYVVKKLRQTPCFAYLHLNDLRSAADLGIVLAYKKYYDAQRSKNVMGYIVSKGYFLAYDILRTEFKMRSPNSYLHHISYHNEDSYQRRSHFEDKKISPYQRTCHFEETMAHVAKELSSIEKQLLRERFLDEEKRCVMAERRGIHVTNVSARITQALNKIRKNLAERDDTTGKQLQELEAVQQNIIKNKQIRLKRYLKITSER